MIKALSSADKDKAGFVPYRNSVLTWLLKVRGWPAWKYV